MRINVGSKDFWVGYITNLENDAKKHLGGRSQDQGSSWVSSDPNHDDSIFFYQDNSVNYFSSTDNRCTSAENSDDEDDNSAAAVAMIIGVVVLIAATFFTALLCSRRSEEETILSQTTEINAKLDKVRAMKDNPPIFDTIKELVTLQIDIQNIDATRTRHYVFVTLGFAMGGVFLFSGGLYVVPWAINAGYTSLFASSILGAVVFGSHWNDDSLKRTHYEAIVGKNGLAQKALSKMNDYDDSLNLACHITHINAIKSESLVQRRVDHF